MLSNSNNQAEIQANHLTNYRFITKMQFYKQLIARVQLRECAYSNSMAIIRYLNELQTAVFNRDGNGSRTGIQAVLDKFFHGGGRSLDDLAGGDSVHHRLVETPDPRWLSWSWIWHGFLNIHLIRGVNFHVIHERE